MEEEVEIGLAAIENSQTIDTTKPDEIKGFLDSIRAVEEGEGAELWALVNRLPLINDAKGLAKTLTRIIKYIRVRNLMNREYEGKF